MSPRLDFELLPHGRGYRLLTPIIYRSSRYRKIVTVEAGFVSDGGSGPAEDVVSLAWWVHDKLCTTWRWDDGAACSNWQASWVLHDILLAEGRWFRARSWFMATWIFGPVRSLRQRVFG